MYVENRTKIANFPTPVYLTPPMKGFPVECGIGVRGPKCLNDGPTRWSKTFSDRFSRFDTIPAVTDSHPASHVAVAITLNAKASSLKKLLPSNKQDLVLSSLQVMQQHFVHAEKKVHLTACLVPTPVARLP